MSWTRWTVASLLLHGSLAGVAFRRARAVTSRAPSALTEFEVVEPLAGAPSDAVRRLRSPSLPIAVNPALGGRRSAQNVDGARPGERGDGRSEEAGLHLAARPEGVNLDDRIMNNLRDRQEQRIHTARFRASPQDDRRTPNPSDDAWVSTGSGVLLFRLPTAAAMPARGASVAAGPPQPPRREGEDPSQVLAAQTDPRVGGGVRDAAGTSHRVAGPMRTQRPSLAQGHASTTSDSAAARPDDDTDSALLAASLQRAFVSSSVHAGPARAEGRGGVGGGGAPGSGGSEGRGGRAEALGEGDGWVSLSSDDARYMRYLLEIRRRLEPLWADAFPHDAALRLEQGTVIVQFVITADGAVRDVVLRRRSGVDRFDANVLAAVRRAALPPIPRALGMDHLNVRAPFEFRNPLVR